MCKYIFVTGGVCSSLGKGVAAGSLGSLLEARGLELRMIKIDPYINVDAGTMNPYQHGEVYVTDDGAETDRKASRTASPKVSSLRTTSAFFGAASGAGSSLVATSFWAILSSHIIGGTTRQSCPKTP